MTQQRDVFRLDGRSAMVTGAALFQYLVVDPAFRAAATEDAAKARDYRARLAAILWIGFALAVLSGAVWLVALAAKISGQGLAVAASGGAARVLLTETQFGHLWIARAFLAGVLFCALWLGKLSEAGRRSGPGLATVAAAVRHGGAGTLAACGTGPPAVPRVGGRRGLAMGPTAAAQAADPISKDACATAYENAQRLRQSGKLRAAKAQLTTCENEACASFMRNDCTKWDAEIAEAMPTIVVGAKDENGHDTSQVRVIVDDVVVADQLDGRPIPVDPGQHHVRRRRLQRLAGREVRQEREVSSRVGRKGRGAE